MSKRELEWIFVILATIIILIIPIVLAIKSNIKSTSNQSKYVETHMEYEKDLNYIKNDTNSLVNDNPLIPNGYFRQEVYPKDNEDIVKIVYYIPEKYIDGNDKLLKINGSEYVKITTKVTNISDFIMNHQADEYLQYLAENTSDDETIISLQTMNCENLLLDVLIKEYENNTVYDLIYIYNDSSYTLEYEISDKADTNEIEVMKKVFASMKLVPITSEQE